jgi:hypothetical protein
MEKHTFSCAVPAMEWDAEFTIDQPVNLEEFQERFGVDALGFALRQIVVNVQNVIRTARKGTKTKDGINDVSALQEIVDAYKPGIREIQPASIRATTKRLKDMDEGQREKIAAAIELLASDPKMLDKLTAAAAKKAAEEK